jgi:predicted transcriptional regulator
MGVTSIRLNPELEEPLEKTAAKLDRSKNYLINQAVKEFLQRQASAEDRWQETLAALDSVKNGNLVNESSVKEWLESWGSENEKHPPKA